MIEAGVLGDDLVFSADGNGAPVRSQQDAVEAVIESVDHRHRGAADFESFRRQVDGRHLQRCILFLPGRAGHGSSECQPSWKVYLSLQHC